MPRLHPWPARRLPAGTPYARTSVLLGASVADIDETISVFCSSFGSLLSEDRAT